MKCFSGKHSIFLLYVREGKTQHDAGHKYTVCYLEFREIQASHTDDLQVYTDGSVPCGYAGYGAAIYAPHSHFPVYESSVEIGETTNNVAELEAIHDALRWIIENSETS